MQKRCILGNIPPKMCKISIKIMKKVHFIHKKTENIQKRRHT